MLLLNPYFYHLITQSLIDSIQQICLILFILSSLQPEYPQAYYLIATASVLNPVNAIVGIQAIISNKSNNFTKNLTIFSSALFFYLLIFLLFNSDPLSFYRELYFPTVFNPQFNVYWIMLAHVPPSLLRSSKDTCCSTN